MKKTEDRSRKTEAGNQDKRASQYDFAATLFFAAITGLFMLAVSILIVSYL